MISFLRTWISPFGAHTSSHATHPGAQEGLWYRRTLPCLPAVQRRQCLVLQKLTFPWKEEWVLSNTFILSLNQTPQSFVLPAYCSSLPSHGPSSLKTSLPRKCQRRLTVHSPFYFSKCRYNFWSEYNRGVTSVSWYGPSKGNWHFS